MELVIVPEFTEIDSFLKRKIVWHYAKNMENILNYSSFLHLLKPAQITLFKQLIEISLIKLNFKLEDIYIISCKWKIMPRIGHFKPQPEEFSLIAKFMKL